MTKIKLEAEPPKTLPVDTHPATPFFHSVLPVAAANFRQFMKSETPTSPVDEPMNRPDCVACASALSARLVPPIAPYMHRGMALYYVTQLQIFVKGGAKRDQMKFHFFNFISELVLTFQSSFLVHALFVYSSPVSSVVG